MSSDIYVDGKPVIQGHTLEIDDDASIGEDLTVGDDATIADELTMTTGGPITTGTNTDLLLVPNGTGITKIGDAGACALGTPLNDDLFVSGREQVLGTSYVGNLSNTEWMSESHDGDDAIYGVGHGGHVFKTDAQKARGTITMGGLPVAAEEFVIDTQTFVWQVDGSGDVNHVTIGGTAAECVTNLVTTFGECTNHGDFTAWDGAGDTVVVEWGTAGVAGNAIASTEACTNMIWDAVTLGTTHAGVAAATLLTIAESKAVSVPGTLTASAGFYLTGNLSISADSGLYTSSPNDNGWFMPANTSQTVNGAFIGTGITGNYLLICETQDRAFDFGHTQQLTPTEYLHSNRQNQTEWMSRAHDTADAIYGVGHGGHVFKTDAQKARGTLTMGGLPVADEEFVIDTPTFVWKADGSGNVNHVTIGGTAAACVTNLVATFAECTNHAAFTAWDGALDTVVVEWGTAGGAGNAIVFTEASTNMTVDGVGTLGATHAGIEASTLLDIGDDKSVTAYKYIAGGCIYTPELSMNTMGTAVSGGLHYSADDGIQIVAGSTDGYGNHNVMVISGDNWDDDYDNQPKSVNPTFKVYSATAAVTATDQWLSHAHNVTDAVKGIGTGSHVTHHAAPTEIADEAEFDLPANSAGWGHVLVGDAEEYAHFVWGSDEVVDLISNSANVVTTDTNTKFCIFDNTGKVSIKNRLGAAKKVMFDYHYTTP